MSESEEQHTKQSNITVELLQKAVESDVPRIYANGFGIGVGNADVVVVLQLNGVPVSVLNLSYTLAKTLAQKLGTVISEFEQNAAQNLLTTDRIDELMRDAARKKIDSARGEKDPKDDVH